MIPPIEFASTFENLDVFGLLNYANCRPVPARIRANPTHLIPGNIVADPAKTHPLLDGPQRSLQPSNVYRIHMQQVKRDTLRTLRPHPRQTRQFINQILQRAFKHRTSSFHHSTLILPHRPDMKQRGEAAALCVADYVAGQGTTHPGLQVF